MDKNMTREERLAAKLRENLRKRKAQGKSQAQNAQQDRDTCEDLSKTAPDS